MSERMSDKRLDQISSLVDRFPETINGDYLRELLQAMKAEREEVDRLQAENKVFRESESIGDSVWDGLLKGYIYTKSRLEAVKKLNLPMRMTAAMGSSNQRHLLTDWVDELDAAMEGDDE